MASRNPNGEVRAQETICRGVEQIGYFHLLPLEEIYGLALMLGSFYSSDVPVNAFCSCLNL
jgi:hypothetical protein